MEQRQFALRGQLYTGKMYSAYQRSQQPSIPSRYEQILFGKINPQEGFGSSSQRFFRKQELSPGPADYNEYQSQMSTSNSKRGFGSLINRTSRFKKFTYQTISPGPGHYQEPKSPSPRQLQPLQPKQAKPIKVIQQRQSITPSPGAYEVQNQATSKQYKSAFKSKTARISFQKQGNGPPVGLYDPKHDLTKSKSVTIRSGFVKPQNFRKQQINQYDPFAKPQERNLTPGPGSYEPKKACSFKILSNMFMIANVDRFGAITQPRRRNTNSPGPGQYNVIYRTIDTTPGAAFVSETQRLTQKSSKHNPGPAYYKITNAKKSHHCNVTGNWVQKMVILIAIIIRTFSCSTECLQMCLNTDMSNCVQSCGCEEQFDQGQFYFQDSFSIDLKQEFEGCDNDCSKRCIGYSTGVGIKVCLDYCGCQEMIQIGQKGFNIGNLGIFEWFKAWKEFNTPKETVVQLEEKQSVEIKQEQEKAVLIQETTDTVGSILIIQILILGIAMGGILITFWPILVRRNKVANKTVYIPLRSQLILGDDSTHDAH